MNVAISTFARRGHLLAAFAVAVLLAASSGTAWAQAAPRGFQLTMGVSPGTLQEGASASNSTPDRVAINITRADPRYSCDHDTDDQTPNVSCAVFNTTANPSLRLTATCNGVASADDDDCDFSVQRRDTGAALSLGTPFSFAADADGGANAIERTIELLVTDDADDDDWNEETVVLTLELAENVTGADTNTYTAREQKRTLTIADDDPMPKLTFDRPGIQLAKGNMQTMTVGVDIGGTSGAIAGIRGKLNSLDGVTDRDGSGDEILLSVSPPEAVGSLIKIWRDSEPDQQATDLRTDREGRYIVGTIGRGTGNTGAGAVGTDDMATNNGIALNIRAIDVSGFRDEQITFTVMEGRTEAQKKGDGGGIDDADPATVTILSAEETPTVTFSTEAIDIDEGDSETVHLLADTDQGSEVGSATVRVSGDALISLSQGGSSISGGTVSFGGSANAELTITALMDRELEDGEEKMATVTITDASGASIGDPRALTVTVVGATAVPALPLIGQLLLALFLMAGGARLYRRRQK